jgi:hypothetical protein
VATLTHEQLTERLKALEIDVTVDYLHGTLTGLACAGVLPDSPHWILQLSECLDGVDVHAHQELLMALQTLCERDLRSTDLDFEPLLPCLDEFLSLRAHALSQWCDGFIGGFVAGQHELAPDDLETLNDIATISQLEKNDDYNNPENANENEQHFQELFEYVRMAAITLFALKPPTAQEAALASEQSVQEKPVKGKPGLSNLPVGKKLS